MAITVPPAPDAIGFGDVTPTSITYTFRSRGNGGSKILEWQVGYGTSPTKSQHYIKSSGTTTVTGLRPATTYYFWSRGRNAKGWGPWSERMSRRTDAGARVKIGGVWKEAVPMIRVKGKWVVAEAWVKTGGKWKKAS
jgi:hypothetical protein